MAKPVIPQFAGSDNEGVRLYKLKQFADEMSRWIDEVQAGGLGTGTGGGGANDDLSYVTTDDESADLPNSRQLIAGQAIEILTAVANQVTINASAYPPQLAHAGVI